MEDPRLSRRIRAALAQRIADGTYQPGARLHIGALADEFGTTRTTVTKAIRLLAEDGPLEYFQGLGWYVRETPG